MTNMGVYEVTKDNYLKLQKSKSFLPLSLPDVFPDPFVQSKKIPRSIQSIWRRPTEEHCKSFQGKYYLDQDDAIIYVHHENLPEAAAKLKIERLEQDLLNALKVHVSGGGESVAAHDVADMKAGKDAPDENLMRVLKEGLRRTPKIEEVRIWAERATQNFSVKDELPQDVKKLLGEYRFAYNSVFNAENSMVIGAILDVNPKGIAARTSEDAMRNAMAQLNAAHVEIRRMAKEGQRALVMVPLDIKVFTEECVKEFILLSLRKMPESVRSLLVIEIRGLRGDKVPPKLVELLTTINEQCRSLVIETGILSCPDFSKYGFKPFCYSFNFNEVKLPKEQILALMKKYVKTYRAMGAKTMIKNVPGNAFLIYCKAMGYTFLSGPLVFTPKLRCPKPYKFMTEGADSSSAEQT